MSLIENKWIIIGICGVTNGGKSTLAKQCKQLLPTVRVISQDNYFYPKDSPEHTFIPNLNHINWELLSSLDMQKMHQDVLDVINSRNTDLDHSESETMDISHLTLEERQNLKKQLTSFNILVLEGFSIFNYEPIDQLCHLKFYLTLDKETCCKRRSNRVYDPADVPGYFEQIVWPEHVKQLEEVERKCKNIIYMTKHDNHLSIVVRNLLQYSNIV